MTARYGIPPVPDGLDESLADVLRPMRLLLLDLQFGRVALPGTSTVTATGSAPAPVPGPPGPAGPPGTPYVPDLTPPPTPGGVIVTAGLDFVFITTDAPTFTQGHGYNRTLVYGATYSGSGPLPTFASAVLVHEFVGQVGSFAAVPGVQWHIWLKWRTNDAAADGSTGLSVSPSGGANGDQVTTAKIGNVHLGPLIVEAGNLANGAVTTAKFASGIEPVAIVAALPSPSGYTGPKTVLLTTDGKLYRYVAGAWTAAVPTVDLVGQITSTQITDGAISTPKLAAGAVTASQIAANTITANEIAANAITASELAANAVVAGKVAAGAINATEIAASAIQAVHLAANSIAVGTAAIQNGAIVNAMIADAAITNAKIVSLAASKITAGSIAVGEYIQSSDFVSGVSGWRLGGNTAELGSASLRGQLTASQIDARGLDIRSSVTGEITFSANGLGVGRGGYVNSDPMLTTPGEWTFSHTPPAYYPAFGPGVDGLQNAWDAVTGAYGEVYSARFPVSPSKTYRITSTLYQWAAGSNVYYLGVRFYDVNGNAIDGSTSGSTGWPGLGSYHYYVSGATMAVGTNNFTFTFGPLGTGSIPPGAVSASVLCLGNYSNLGSARWSWGGARVREVVDGNTLSITASNASTYIASAAIGDAQIGSLNASKITAGTLDAARIAAGSLNADKLIAGTITTDRLVTNAATVAAANSTNTSTLLNGAGSSSITIPLTNVVSLTSTGSAVTLDGVLWASVSTLLAAAVENVELTYTVWIDGVQQTNARQVKVRVCDDDATKFAAPVRVRFTGAPVAAGSHTYSFAGSLTGRNSSGALVALGASQMSVFITADWDVTENKV